MTRIKYLPLFLFFLLILESVVSAQEFHVLVVEVDEVIDQATVELVTEAIDKAEIIDAQAIVLLLDTPGGGADQTFEIADIILDSRIPVIGFVYPKGATAWSAGTFIIPKKDNRVRWVSDFRRLNANLIRRQYELPRIQDILHRRQGYKYFTKLDITKL